MFLATLKNEENNDKKSIIIIGAGLAGLFTGCYSQINGYQTHIFEHYAMPGGVATSWKRKGYTIDGGIHFLMCHKPAPGAFELSGQAQADVEIAPVYQIFYRQICQVSLRLRESYS